VPEVSEFAARIHSEIIALLYKALRPLVEEGIFADNGKDRMEKSRLPDADIKRGVGSRSPR
jgi:hypothetical protein